MRPAARHRGRPGGGSPSRQGAVQAGPRRGGGRAALRSPASLPRSSPSPPGLVPVPSGARSVPARALSAKGRSLRWNQPLRDAATEDGEGQGGSEGPLLLCREGGRGRHEDFPGAGAGAGGRRPWRDQRGVRHCGTFGHCGPRKRKWAGPGRGRAEDWGWSSTRSDQCMQNFISSAFSGWRELKN